MSKRTERTNISVVTVFDLLRRKLNHLDIILIMRCQLSLYSFSRSYYYFIDIALIVTSIN